MTHGGAYYVLCASREPRRANCESRQEAMSLLDSNIKRARDTGGSAGMLDNGRWEIHFPNKAMILYWVEGPDGEVQQFP
jgi:hypothetical protein